MTWLVAPATTRLPEVFSLAQTAPNNVLARSMASSQRWFARKRRILRI